MSEVDHRSTDASSARGEALHAAAEAARERQSHVRHELRSPLAVMYPLLSLLLDGGAGELTAKQREYLEVLERSVVRLEGLIGGVADSGWADCSVAPPAPTDVSLSDVVDDVLSARRAGVGTTGRIDVRSGPGPLPHAWVDRDDARQIVAGLVGNAVCYAAAGGTITVRIDAGDGPCGVEVAVSDTGPGIPPSELGHVFDFGFRGELARELGVPGLGAGLWVCRELARRNGGDVTLSTASGVGTTATVSLPAAHARS